jgi:NADPH:quinone reductase-like Zn-dependent oxidoreductase
MARAEVDRLRGWTADLIDLCEKGAVKPAIARSFKFDDAAAPNHFIQDRKNISKVILVP